MSQYQNRDRVRMRHMLRYSREAVSLIQGRTRLDLDSDRLLNLALMRLIKIVGEAVSRVSQEARERYVEVP